ncbi:hypothetical protein LTR27_005590 [Elasticomyces elasticus]|nr:hypothetical protein LTR27_005590 [Elasticomyces elasticus]
MAANMNSSELTTELKSLGVLYVDSTTPTATVKIRKKHVQIDSILEKHAETMSQLRRLGVQNVRLFYFNENTNKPRHFFTGTVSISGSEIRMYFENHAADDLLSRAQYTGSGTGFFKMLMEKGDKVPKHEFRVMPALPYHPADIPTSDQSRLLSLPKELRDNVTLRCLGQLQIPEFNGYPPPKPFDKIFGASLPRGENALRASRRTEHGRKFVYWRPSIYHERDVGNLSYGHHWSARGSQAGGLEDVAKELDEYDIPFGLDLVIWHPASSKMCVGCLIDQVLVAVDESGLESFYIHAIKSVDSGRSLEPRDNPCGDFTSSPNVRILALQKFDVQGGSSSNVYRMMQLHLGGKVTLQSIIRPDITAWRSLIEPDFSSQTLMRRLLLDQTTSPVISVAEAEVIGRELWAQPEAPDGAWSQMLTGVQAKLGSLLSGKATPE